MSLNDTDQHDRLPYSPASGGETPRTDAVVEQERQADLDTGEWYTALCGELTKLARQLERELADAKADAEHNLKLFHIELDISTEAKRELAAANAAREGAMEEAALICETKAAVFYQERNFLAQSSAIECADAIRRRRPALGRGREQWMTFASYTQT